MIILITRPLSKKTLPHDKKLIFKMYFLFTEQMKKSKIILFDVSIEEVKQNRILLILVFTTSFPERLAIFIFY